MLPTANIWTSLSTQTITELIALLPEIITTYPESDAPTHLYEFLVSNMKGPKSEDRPPNSSCTASKSQEFQSENHEFQSESTGNEMRRQLRPRTSIHPSSAPKPAAQITLGSSSRASKSHETKNCPPSRRTAGAKSKRCCRDGARVEFFEGPPKKRANIDDGEQESEEDTDDEEATWQTDGSPPPPDAAMLTRIAELANLCSSDILKQIQNLLAVLQEQTCATINPTSAEDLTLKKLIHKCQTNDEHDQYLSFISMLDNIRLAFHLAFFKLSPRASFSQLEKDMGLSKGSVSNMSKRGQRLAFIACADISRFPLSGTPYILLLIAVSGMNRRLVHRSKVTHDMISTFCKVLRSPKLWAKEDGTVKHVARIVELMATIHLRSQSQLQFPIFAKGLDGCSKDIILNFSDISGCDALLSSLPFKYVF
ncbi:hypothetical protein BDR03DRAFT_987309 [Suillus americanus]|nr:hypothetical protein BDR03DRAFT_987309 [Suillus americanus]